MDNICKRAILAYMSTRCDVTSQHKLPTREEFYSTVILGDLFRRSVLDSSIDDLISEKKIHVYGPYMSDHAIDVL